MRHSSLVCIGAFASLVGLAACGGGGYQSPPTQPSPSPTPSPSTGTGTAISIVGDRGNQSFSPNPSTVTGGMASWRNTDSTVHRILADDGSFDTGNIAPGQTSTPKAVPAAGINYHCTIHPGMVGTINAQS